jgi:hypothetical protein
LIYQANQSGKNFLQIILPAISSTQGRKQFKDRAISSSILKIEKPEDLLRFWVPRRSSGRGEGWLPSRLTTGNRALAPGKLRLLPSAAKIVGKFIKKVVDMIYQVIQHDRTKKE